MTALPFSRSRHFTIPLFPLWDNAVLKWAFSVQKLLLTLKTFISAMYLGRLKGTDSVLQFICEPKCKCTLATAFCVEEIWPYDAEQWFLTWEACPRRGEGGGCLLNKLLFNWNKKPSPWIELKKMDWSTFNICPPDFVCVWLHALSGNEEAGGEAGSSLDTY